MLARTMLTIFAVRISLPALAAGTSSPAAARAITNATTASAVLLLMVMVIDATAASSSRSGRILEAVATFLFVLPLAGMLLLLLKAMLARAHRAGPALVAALLLIWVRAAAPATAPTTAVLLLSVARGAVQLVVPYLIERRLHHVLS